MKTLLGIASLVTIFLLITLGIQLAGTELLNNNNGYVNLNENSKDYIRQYSTLVNEDFNKTTINGNAENIEKIDNSTGEPTTDYSIEFFDADSKSKKSKSYVSSITNMPTFIMLSFGGENTDWKDYLLIIGSFITILLFVVGYLFLKGRVTEN